MKKRLVMACFGDAASTAAIARHAENADVIAVVVDLSGVIGLGDARDAALAAGAVRCHVLDIREEFLRDVMVPALRHAAPEGTADRGSALALAFVTDKLRDIARLERADWATVSHIPLAPRIRPSHPTLPPAHLEIRVDHGIPVAINGVELSLTELFDSLEVITGQSALALLAERLRAAAAPDGEMRHPRDLQFA